MFGIWNVKRVGVRDKVEEIFREKFRYGFLRYVWVVDFILAILNRGLM